MTDRPILAIWDGESMTPASNYWARRADAQFVVGQRYQVEIRQERSDASHRQYFAAIKEAWESLPESLTEQHQTPEHLRKHALIRVGYRDERTIVAASKAEAQRLAAFIKPMDSYAIVSVTDAVVRVWTAQSQSYRAMDRETFAASKQKVLDYIASLIGVTGDELGKANAA